MLWSSPDTGQPSSPSRASVKCSFHELKGINVKMTNLVIRSSAGVLFEVSRVKEPPIRLVRGRFSSKYVKEGYDESLAELERWSDLSLSTEYGRRAEQALRWKKS